MVRICKEYMDNVRPYKPGFIIAIGGGCMIAGFSIMLTYYNPVIRYAMIVIVVLIAFMMKNYILSVLRILSDLRKG